MRAERKAKRRVDIKQTKREERRREGSRGPGVQESRVMGEWVGSVDKAH